ncbi:putative Sulfatase N-terminal domain-containing protein [Seiridium unicorne]|uniref:Sulfatase N-terminal domain-containing protein n=1 Tax=Seiridium unicorne TaxID=138068 RepID=A0ABR2V6E8_9PEZI
MESRPPVPTGELGRLLTPAEAYSNAGRPQKAKDISVLPGLSQLKNPLFWGSSYAPAWVQTVSSDVDESHEGLLNADSASQVLELSRNSLPRKRPSSHVSDLSEDPTNRPSATESSENYCPTDFSWLMSPELPDKHKIVILVEEFFARMHHLRCFGFIHKPSYLQQLDEQPRKIQQGNTLLHAICALGAKFYALKSAEHIKLPEDFALRAIILLHEHDLRVGDYASAFMLTGLAFLDFLVSATAFRLLNAIILTKILKYVKHFDTALPPWLQGSDFAQLESALFSWYEELPGNLQFTQIAIYMRKESSQLGALLLLHWTYHQSLCDLNRIGMRDLFQIRKAINFPPDQSDFQKRTQDRCNEHATAIALMFAEASKHGSTSLEAPTQFTPEYILNPLAIYRMARRDIDKREKYAPERASSPSSVSPETAETTTSPRTPRPPSLPTVGDAAVPPIENPAAFNGPWFDSGVSNTMPVGDNFPLPSSDDNLQNGQYGLYNNRHHFTTFDLVESGPALLNKNQYLTAILGKVHVGPDHVYPWEIREESETRDVAYISDRAINVFERSKSENRPFFLTIGFIDPHRDRTRSGFGNEGPFDERVKRIEYDTSDVEIPEFLSDLPGTRQEFANYYESISRLDQGVGQILEGLKKAGLSDDTLVIFISDNGPPFINSKTTLYDAGVNLPLIVRQPGSPPSIVNPNLISWVDIIPTILDYAGIDAGKGSPERPGRSFLPILSTTEELADWDKVSGVDTFHEITNYWPTRYVRSRRYKYHRNLAWRLDFPFAADIYGSLTWEDIRNDEAKMVGNRPLKDYFFRPPEELYDLENDPLEVANLVKDSAHEKILNELRQDLEAWQRRTEDAWLYRDGISVLFVKHHLDAGMQMPDHVDFDLDKLATRGPGVKLYENKPFGSQAP